MATRGTPVSALTWRLIVRLRLAGASIRRTARAAGVSPATVAKYDPCRRRDLDRRAA